MENPFVIAMNSFDFELKDIQIAWYYYTIGTKKNNTEILIAFFISLPLCVPDYISAGCSQVQNIIV